MAIFPRSATQFSLTDGECGYNSARPPVGAAPTRGERRGV